MRHLFVLTLLLTACKGMADVIVLKTGKRFEINGSYEEKGQMALFKDRKGELIQLPLSLIDVPKSQQATEAQKAKLAEEATVQAKPSLPLTEIQKVANSIEPTEDGETRQTRTITNDDLGRYTPQSYPAELPENSSQAGETEYEGMRSVAKKYDPIIKQRIREVEEQIAKHKELIRRIEAELPTADSKNRRALQLDLETLRAQVQKMESWLAKARATERMAGQFVD